MPEPAPLDAVAVARRLAAALFAAFGAVVVMSATITLVALAASLVPAWRAARVDPAVALRAE